MFWAPYFDSRKLKILNKVVFSHYYGPGIFLQNFINNVTKIEEISSEKFVSYYRNLIFKSMNFTVISRVTF